MSTTYKQAGVDIEAGDALVERIKPLAARTKRPELLSGVGGFGAFFALPPGKYQAPVLVSGTDGVGTKLKVAFEAGHHRSVGIDLVAMSVNDVLTSGAEPLFFLDYYATSKLDVGRAEEVIAGIAAGCELAGCSLVGGETAELPGFYAPGEYELAGFCVGVVERDRIITGDRVAPGDSVIGLGSSGLHSNGYSLARRVLLEQHRLSLSVKPHRDFTQSLGEALLEPTRIYVRPVRELLDEVEVKGLAHITGGGLPGNLPRCMPPGTRAVLEERAWTRHPLFELISDLGAVERDEMFSTFNMGLGMVAIVPAAHAPAAVRFLRAQQLEAWEVGVIESAPNGAEPTVVIVP